MRYRRSASYSLRYWDKETGFGIVTGKHKTMKSLILPPLSLMAYTFADNTFSLEGFRAFLNQFPDIREKLDIDICPEKCLTALQANGLLENQDSRESTLESGSENENETPLLRSLYFYLTSRCNHACYHCYQKTVKQVDETPSISSDEISTNQIIQFIDSAIPLGLRSVKFTGGEPFLRKDMLDLVREAYLRGLQVSIEANGFGISDKAAALLAEYGVQVSISLDGSNKEVHDGLRGKKGAFDTALTAIKNLKSAGCEVKVITAVSLCNIKELEKIAELISIHGVTGWKINPVNELGVAGESRKAHEMLVPVAIFNLFQRIRTERFRERYGLIIFLEGPPVFSSLKDIAETGCGTCPFLNIMGVLADGRLSFCGIGYTHPELTFGHSSDNLADLWHNHNILQQARAQIPEQISEPCSHCVFIQSCMGSCRALAYQAGTGHFTDPHPWCKSIYDQGMFPKHYLLTNITGVQQNYLSPVELIT